MPAPQLTPFNCKTLGRPPRAARHSAPPLRAESCAAGALAATFLLAGALAAGAVEAAVPAAEAAKLKSELTPVGAERNGNADGTIPAWTGGFAPKTAAISGRRPDPYATEKPLFSVNAQNMAKYADKLTPGTVAMLKKYPATFRVDVYPTHRTAAMPQAFYDATFANATTGKLVIEANGRSRPEGITGGVPFPIPKDGREVMANHLRAYYDPVRQTGSNYLIQADGKRILVSTYTNEVMRYNYVTPERSKDGLQAIVRSRTTNPPIRAGEAIISATYDDSTKDAAWVYLPGQRRIRKLPNSCCDTPTPFSSGLISFDEIVVYLGSTHRFDWTILGKKEILVPYNDNRAFVPPKNDAVFSEQHMNPDALRWELHRVWVVEAKLRPGERHISPRGVYYVDEDSWNVLLGDRYDAQGALSRTGFTAFVLLTEGPSLYPGIFGWYDLNSGAAYIGNVYNESSEQLKVFDSFADSLYAPDALAAEGIR